MMGSANDINGAHSSIDPASFHDLFPVNWGDIDLNLDAVPRLDAFLNSPGDANSTLAPPMHGMKGMQGEQQHEQSSQNHSSSDSDKSLSPAQMNHMPGLKQQASQPMMGGSEPVTKARTGPGRIPRNRPKPQNLFNVWSQPQHMAQPMMAPMGYPSTLPYMATAEMMQGGSPVMGPVDPYNWMQSRHKRPSPFFGQPPSPSLLYNPYCAPMASPPFGTMQYGLYQPHPPMKLPVQALHRPTEPPRRQETSNISHAMPPLVLPADLGKSRNGTTAPTSGVDQVDPAAIPNAITSFLGNGDSAGLDANMRLYEITFKSFVKEEAQLDYTNVTVVELKRLLRKYQLQATGRKEDLIMKVKDVAAFLKKLPVFKDDASQEESKEEMETAGNNMAEGNGQQSEFDRFLA